jgi:predicted RNase H-like HicB family nuclease
MASEGTKAPIVAPTGETAHSPFAVRARCGQQRPKVCMLRIELERESDGRWIAEVPALPGVQAYGDTEAKARALAISLALRVIADRIDNGETLPAEARNLFAA